MQKLNFILKFSLAFSLFVFALWYNSIAYNIALGSALIILLIKEEISLFRFPRQRLIFALFLLAIFIFQAVNSYGKILFNFPFGITITDIGILTATKFVTQILLIFLLFGAAVYSSKKEEILYYLSKAQKPDRIKGQKLDRFLRIGVFSFYMVPKSLRVQKDFSNQIRSDTGITSQKIVKKVKIILDHIYGFIYAIIKSAEREYPAFAVQREQSNDFSPQSIFTLKAILISFTIFIIHGILIWQH